MGRLTEKLKINDASYPMCQSQANTSSTTLTDNKTKHGDVAQLLHDNTTKE